MQLDLQLTKRQGLSGESVPGPAGSEVHRGLRGRRGTGLRLVKVEESLEGSKLCAFNVDFQEIDEIVSVVVHEPAEAPHLDVCTGTVFVDGTKCPGLEVGAVGVSVDFRTPL